jgi:hypothetical protein
MLITEGNRIRAFIFVAVDLSDVLCPNLFVVFGKTIDVIWQVYLELKSKNRGKLPDAQ